MAASLSHRRSIIVLAALVFCVAAPLLLTMSDAMIKDGDPFWHLATGQWILEHRAIPVSDPWSYTAGDTRWLNVAWLWDVLFAQLFAYSGWHGGMAMNALIVALALAAIAASCRWRSGDTFSALLTTLMALTMLNVQLRPLQISNFMVAVFMLVLGMAARRECRAYWLALLPLLCIPWVNLHGGFMIIPVLLGAFFLQAILQRQYTLAAQLTATGVACVAALLLNPYGVSIFEAVWRPVSTDGMSNFINEWQPFSASAGGLLNALFALFFLMLVIRQPLPILPAERWLAYGWLLIGLTAVRHLPIFTVIAAPVFASALRLRLMPAQDKPDTKALQCLSALCDKTAVAAVAVIAAAGVALWLPSPAASRYYPALSDKAVPTLAPEIAFIDAHYPHTRFLNHFNLGGLLIYETRGRIPVFIDGRTQTAYPPAILESYKKFEFGEDGWEDMLDRYRIGGALIPNVVQSQPAILDRFNARNGWKKALSGPYATIFIRTP